MTVPTGIGGRGPGLEQAIVVGGRPVLTAVPVKTWVESGLSFKGRPRKHTRHIFLHWTGGEGGGNQLHQVLSAKRQSVHFLVDALANVWQFCDANLECAHARGFNEESVGIEITSRGDDAHVKDKLVVRRDVADVVHGRPIRYGDFTDGQKEAVLALVETLCRAYHLPMAVPLDASGEVVTGVLAPAYLARWHGVLGHYQTRLDKRDPAPGLLRLVRDRGQARGLG